MAENLFQKQQREKRDAEIRKLYPEKTLMEIGKIYDLKAQRIHQIIVKEKVAQESGKVEIKHK